MQEVGPKGGKQDSESWGAALEPILSVMQLLGGADLKLLLWSPRLLLWLCREGLRGDVCVPVCNFGAASAGSAAWAVMSV